MYFHNLVIKMGDRNNKKINFVLSFLIVFLLLISVFSVYDAKSLETNSNMSKTSIHVSIQDSNPKDIASDLESKGFDVLWDSLSLDSIDLVVNSKELHNLKLDGFEPLLVEEGRPFKEIQAELGNEGYPELSEIIETMNETQKNYPQISKVVDLTEDYEQSPTYNGKHLYGMKISDNVGFEEDEPSFLLVSCHHAREIVTPLIALYAIEQLTSLYGEDSEITKIVDEYEIWILPMCNPDGYDYVLNVDNWWRKNRRYFPEEDGYGVDQNRNYPFGWSSSCSGSTRVSSGTYKGPSPASEPETQTIIALSHDQHFAKVLDFHSYGRYAVCDYGCHDYPFSPYLKYEALKISLAAGYGLTLDDAGVEGMHYQWQMFENGSYAYLVETHNEFQPEYESALEEAEQVWPCILHVLNRPIPLSGHIQGKDTEELLDASLEVIDVGFANGETFKCDPATGRYHLFVPMGTYTLEFSSNGYLTQTHSVSISELNGNVLDVELVKSSNKPSAPQIEGPSSVKIGRNSKFTFTSYDYDEDPLYLFVDWGDGSEVGWIGPFNSGEEMELNHMYSSEGDIEISAIAKDYNGIESDIGTMSLSVSRAKALNKNLLNFFLKFDLFRQLLESIHLSL